MLTKLTIRNFKRFEEVEIELGNPVVRHPIRVCEEPVILPVTLRDVKV